MLQLNRRLTGRSPAAYGGFAAAALAAAAAAYLFNPKSGAERRAKIRDQVSRLSSRVARLGQFTDEAGVLVDKSIEVYADVDEVYDAWRDLKHLPEFMTHLREVRKVDDNVYHWVVDGPAGTKVEWDARITADVPNELIAWRTLEGSAVQSSGVVQFDATSYGGTRLHVRMYYRPPANALGHTIAKIFGRDSKRQMDEDLYRFKRLIEMGSTPQSTEDASRFSQSSQEAALRH